MSVSSAEQKQNIEAKINEERAKARERIARLIDKEKDTVKLINLIDEEKAKSLKKIEQLKAQKYAIEAREKNQERKARTRRLIQHGALAEKYFNCSKATTSEFENLLKRVVNQIDLDRILYEIQAEQEKKE